MTKRELIDEITHLNTSAQPGFLAEFDPDDLCAYLERLQRVEAAGAAPKHQPDDPEERPATLSDKAYTQRDLQPALL